MKKNSVLKMFLCLLVNQEKKSDDEFIVLYLSSDLGVHL